MGALAAAAPVIGAVAGVAGLGMQFAAGRKASKAAKKQAKALKIAADFEAAQMEQEQGQVLASAQRAVMEEDRRTRLAESRAQALAAASGAGGMTVSDVISDIAAEGAYRASVARYEGEDRARKLRLAAQTRRLEGQLGLSAGEAGARALSAQATANLVTGAGSLLAKYGGDIAGWAGGGESDILMQDFLDS